MTTFNIHEAKTQLSRLVDRAVSGEAIVIARSGRPVARLVALDPPPAAERRLGFLRGRITVPEDFDRWGTDEIADIFDGTE